MGRMTITEDNRTGAGGEGFPRMKLKTGDKARFVLYQDPWGEWVHELKAPVIENGVGVKVEKQRKDKSTYFAWQDEFIRRSICLGNRDVLAEKGSDPANCPACKAAQDYSDFAKMKAVQRFAANVLVYELAGNSWNVRKPFGARILVWQFTARMWDDLITLATKMPDQKLNTHDLTLECEDGDWQRNKLSFELVPAWQGTPDGLAFIQQLLADPANQATDDELRLACGQVANRSYMEDDVRLILGRWNQINNSGSAGSVQAAATAVDLGAGLDGLLGSTQAASANVPDFLASPADAAAGYVPAPSPFTATVTPTPANSPIVNPGVYQTAAGSAPNPFATAPQGQAFPGAVAAELAGTPFAVGAPQAAQPVQQAMAAAQAAGQQAAMAGSPLSVFQPGGEAAIQQSVAAAQAQAFDAALGQQPAPAVNAVLRAAGPQAAQVPVTAPAAPPDDLDFNTLMNLK